MPTLQDWISQRPSHLDVVAPIKACACDALQAVLNTRRRHTFTNPRLMRRGAERC
ncbi:MAG: hypothetical protein PHQ28_04275 [Mycobacterium sp.]|nr:hypothetical protein [Mycobacterium sp.]